MPINNSLDALSTLCTGISHDLGVFDYKTYFRRSSLLSARFVPQEIHACGAGKLKDS